MSKYLIAGVTGHVGAVVASELDKAGASYRVLVSSESKASAFRDRGVDVRVGELENKAALIEALRGAEGAFLLLPPPRALPATAAEFFAYQRAMAGSIADAVKASGVAHVVLLSSIGAHLPEGTGPIKGLYVLEQRLRELGVTFTAVRAAYFMENFGGFAGAIQGGGVLPNFLREDVALSMVATRDIGVVAAKALLDPPAATRIIELAGPADHKPAEQAAIFGGVLGRAVSLMSVPEPGVMAAMLGSGVPQAMAENYAEMYSALNSGHLAFEHPEAITRGRVSLEEFARGMFKPQASA